MFEHWMLGFPYNLCTIPRRWSGCSSSDGWVQQAHVSERYQKRGQRCGGEPSRIGRRFIGWWLRVSAKIQEQPATPLPERLAAPRHGGQRCDGRPQEKPLRLLQLQRIRWGSSLAVLLRNRGQLRLPHRYEIIADVWMCGVTVEHQRCVLSPWFSSCWEVSVLFLFIAHLDYKISITAEMGGRWESHALYLF